MNIDRSKSKLSTIALILLLTISATLVALPAAVAQDQSKATVCYLGVNRNPVGINQPVLLHVGITDYLSSVEMGFEDLSISIIDPEGIESTIPDIRTDSTGGTGRMFTPTKVGKYILQAHFPTQTRLVSPFFYGQPYNLTYLASDSEVVELVVQAEPIPYYPGHSIPSEYWTRPINSQLREWSAVSGSWVRDPDNLYAPYNELAPDTAHILWTTQMDDMGGLAGGKLESHSFGIGDAYEGKFSSRFILAGRFYYTTGGSRSQSLVLYHCIDIHTGEELWSKVFMNNASISFGQVLYFDGQNYHGAFAYLYVSSGGDWYAFDAYTGNWRFTVQDVPSGTTLYGPRNEIYLLNVNTGGDWMALWSMELCCLGVATGYGAGSWGNTVHEQTINATEQPDAWIWNVSIPEDISGSVVIAGLNDRVVGGSVSQQEVNLWGLSLEEDEEGTELFNNTWEAPDYWAETNMTVIFFGSAFVAASLESRVAVLWCKETREHYGFSLETGDYIWGPTPRQYYLDALMDFVPRDRHIAYGNFYSASVGGILYCYNATTGELKWNYTAYDPYGEFLWSNHWWVGITFITDGKVYMGHLEHSPVDPRPRGGPFVCVDAETGDEVWRINGGFRQTHWGGKAIIGDSIMVTQNTYDQRVYAVGIGPSATTVTAPDTTQPLGTPILIQGTVMDVSPGTEDAVLQMRFPNGVPAVSDESMSEWMKYVYMQFGIPADPTGVEVILNAVDSDGTWLDVDRTTTDMSGTYSYQWAPPAEGKYTIVATFMGSGGYYASYAQTAISVGPAPAAYPVPPTADEIAAETISRLPAYPDVPSATAVAQETISQLPAYPEIPEIPAYLTIDLAIIVAVVIAIVIGLYGILKKQK
jgi:outer membrane protein assembly factor BamB